MDRLGKTAGYILGVICISLIFFALTDWSYKAYLPLYYPLMIIAGLFFFMQQYLSTYTKFIMLFMVLFVSIIWYIINGLAYNFENPFTMLKMLSLVIFITFPMVFLLFVRVFLEKRKYLIAAIFTFACISSLLWLHFDDTHGRFFVLALALVIWHVMIFLGKAYFGISSTAADDKANNSLY